MLNKIGPSALLVLFGISIVLCAIILLAFLKALWMRDRGRCVKFACLIGGSIVGVVVSFIYGPVMLNQLIFGIIGLIGIFCGYRSVDGLLSYNRDKALGNGIFAVAIILMFLSAFPGILFPFKLPPLF
ncbi:MAG: hypothetical protein GY793_06810 [Proteobacteria bacterium]|nr:hypothetical protein [Pseudomonadota bacterium]